jgi:hypothetical protein
MDQVGPEDDSKLQHLKQSLLAKIDQPINPGNRKVLLFTAFADTADYLYANLAQPLRQAHGIHTGKVTGADGPKSTLAQHYDFQSLLTLFAPRAKRKAEILPHEPAELDLLIATDCISEGQNLQDCDYLVNYDIHWNPVRIIQRFGRIDRIGSPNARIQLVNFWPAITDLGLNDFRMDLLNYLKTHQDLPGLPNGLHAVVPAEPDKGLVPGVIFVLRNRNHGVNIQQKNRLHPYYLIYMADDGRVVANHTEAKRLLDLARAACKARTAPVADVCRRFNAATDDGRDMRRCSDLLDAAIHAMIQQKAADDIDSLFTGQRTTALLDDIEGLDDFELINFLVVLAPNPDTANRAA